MCLSLYDYQPKAGRYRKGLTYLKNGATTNQKHTIVKKKKKKTKENTRVREKEIIKPQKETENDKGTKRKQNRLGNKV